MFLFTSQIQLHSLTKCPLPVQRLPQRIIEKAVWGMMPKGRLGRKQMTHLKVFKGTNHPHEAQQPKDITSRINQAFSGPLINA